MKMLKQQRRIKRAIAFCGLICLGGGIGSFPGAAQLPRFEEPRSPAPKPPSQPAPQPPTQPKPPAPQQPPARPKPPEPVVPPSDGVPIVVPAPEPVVPPSDGVPIVVPAPEPVSPPSDAVPIVVPAPEPVVPPSDAVPIVVPPPSTSPSPTPKPPTPVPVPPPPLVTDTSSPLPEQRQETLAVLSPVNGFVSVKLINRTLATINYEIIGDTTLRTLPGKSEVTLRGLMTPVNVAFRRNDNGFLLIQGTVNQEGILELNMTETNVFDLDRTTLSIEENGSAFLN